MLGATFGAAFGKTSTFSVRVSDGTETAPTEPAFDEISKNYVLEGTSPRLVDKESKKNF